MVLDHSESSHLCLIKRKKLAHDHSNMPAPIAKKYNRKKVIYAHHPHLSTIFWL